MYSSWISSVGFAVSVTTGSTMYQGCDYIKRKKVEHISQTFTYRKKVDLLGRMSPPPPFDSKVAASSFLFKDDYELLKKQLEDMEGKQSMLFFKLLLIGKKKKMFKFFYKSIDIKESKFEKLAVLI